MIPDSSLKPIVAYYGHHKCASSWFRRIFEDVGRWTEKKFEGYDNPSQFDYDLRKEVSKRNLELISFTNAEKKYVAQLANHKAVHLIRDPRDILVSAYFSHLNSHATDGWEDLIPHREKLQSLDFEKGLLEEIKFSECYLRQMYEWDYQQENVLEIRFEEITKNPYETVLNVFQHLGLSEDTDATPWSRLSGFSKVAHLGIKRRMGNAWPFVWKSKTIPSHQLLLITYQQRYKKLAGGRKKGEENKNSHYRKGKSGDWKNYFTPKIQDAFDQNYPEFVMKLGYFDRAPEQNL